MKKPLIKTKKNRFSKNKKSYKKGGNKIFADKVDKDGNKRRFKDLKEGECLFPFEYKKKKYNECAPDKTGKWCPTEISGDKITKWGYCESYLKQHMKDSEDKTEKPENKERKVVKIIIDSKKYLLDKNTRNVYSYPNKNGNYYFVGRLLPNNNIDFNSEEYIPSEVIIKEEVDIE